MHHNILVSMDSSELAECVLSHVETITKGWEPSARLLLVAFLSCCHYSLEVCYRGL